MVVAVEDILAGRLWRHTPWPPGLLLFTHHTPTPWRCCCWSACSHPSGTGHTWCTLTTKAHPGQATDNRCRTTSDAPQSEPLQLAFVAVGFKSGNESFVARRQPMDAAQPSEKKCWERPCFLLESNPRVGLAGSQAGGFFSRSPASNGGGEPDGCTGREKKAKVGENGIGDVIG